MAIKTQVLRNESRVIAHPGFYPTQVAECRFSCTLECAMRTGNGWLSNGRYTKSRKMPRRLHEILSLALTLAIAFLCSDPAKAELYEISTPDVLPYRYALRDVSADLRS